jgi:uncharacterized protein YfiM (DUF2279 family)
MANDPYSILTSDEAAKVGAANAIGYDSAQIRSVKEHREWAMKSFQRAATAAGWGGKTILDVMHNIDVGSEEKIWGTGMKGLEALHAVNIEWDSPDQRVFRFHNHWAFRELAASAWALKEAVVRNPTSTVLHLNPAIGNNPAIKLATKAILSEAGKILEKEGQGWAKTHPDEVDHILEAGFSPLNFIGEAIGAYKVAAKAVEANEIAKVLEEVRAIPKGAAQGAEQRRILSKLSGGPISGGLLDIVNSKGLDVEKASKWLHSLQYRATGFPELLDTHIVPEWLRRQHQLYAAEMHDLIHRSKDMLEAIKRDFLEGVTKAATSMQGTYGDPPTKEELSMIQQLLQKIPRPAWTGTAQFMRGGYQVVPKAGDYLRGYVQSLLYSGQWAAEFPGLREPSAFEIETAARASDHIRSGIRPGASYMERYAPGVKLEVDHTLQHLIDQAQSDPFRDRLRPWEMHREGDYREILDPDEFNKWLAEVLTRNSRIEKWNGFISEVRERDAQLAKFQAAATDPVQVERFQRARESLKRLADVTRNPKLNGNPVVNWEPIPGLKPVELYNKMIAPLKRLRTVYSVPWHAKKYIDTNLKNLLSGVPGVRWAGAESIGRLPTQLRGINGQLLDFGHSLVQEAGEYDTLSSNLSKLSGSYEQHASNALGSAAYGSKMAEAQGAGIAAEDAHDQAYKYAKDLVSKFHYDYQDAPFVWKIAEPLYDFGQHHFHNAALYTSLAAEHPAEAVYATKLLDAQYRDASMDRQGNIRFPGTDMAIDPDQFSTARRVAALLARTDQVVPPGDSSMAKAIKAAHWLGGDFSIVPKAALTMGGELSLASMHEPSSLIDTVDKVSKALKTGSFSPSEDALRFMGWDGKMPKDQFEQQKINEYYAASQLSDKPITAQQAQDVYRQHAAIADVLSQTTGVQMTPTPQGAEKLKVLRDTYGQIETQVGRDAFLSMHPEVNNVTGFPRYANPDQKAARSFEQMQSDDAYLKEAVDKAKLAPQPEKESFIRSLPTEVMRKAKEFWGDILDNIKPGEASAAETPERKVVYDPKTKLYSYEDQQVTPQDTIAAHAAKAQAIGLSNIEITHAVDEAYSQPDPVKAQARITAVPGLPEALKHASANDFKARAVDKFLTDPANNPTDAVKHNELRIQDAAKAAAELNPSAGLRYVKNPTVDSLKALVGNRITAGTDLEAVNQDMAVRISNALATKAGGYHMAVEKQQQVEYPETNAYLSELKSAAYRSPYSIPAVLDKGIKLAQNQQLSPDFFSRLRETNPGLWGDMTTAYYRPELDLATKQLFPFGVNKEINPVRLGEMLLDPHGQLLVGILRDHGAPQVTDKLNELATTPIPLHDGMTLDDLTSNRQQAFSQAIHDVDIRTGLQPDFQQTMRTLTAEVNTPLPVAQQAPADLVQTSTSTAPPPSISAAPTAPDFTGATQSLGQMADSFVHNYDIRPTKSIEPPTYTPLTSRFYSTAPQILQGYSQYRTQEIAQARQIEIEGGHPEGSLTPNLFSSWVAFSSNPDGSASMNPLPAMGAAATLAQLGDRLAGDAPDSVAARSINGFSTALSSGIAAGTMATWLGAGAAAGPIGLAVGLAAGLATGLMKGKKQDNSEAMEMQRQRIALQREQFEEQQRKQSVNELQTRERTLAQAASTGTAQQRQQLAQANALNQFRVRPTYGSRIGMVDSVERELASALKPHW